MSLYTLTDFQRLSGLNDSAMLWLLKNGQLTVSSTESGLMVEFDITDSDTLIKGLCASKHGITDAQKVMITEAIATVLREEFSQMVDQALSRAQALAKVPKADT